MSSGVGAGASSGAGASVGARESVCARAGADAAADSDADAVSDAAADSVAGADAVAPAPPRLAHDAEQRGANVVEGVEQLGVDLVDVAKRQGDVETRARLPRPTRCDSALGACLRCGRCLRKDSTQCYWRRVAAGAPSPGRETRSGRRLADARGADCTHRPRRRHAGARRRLNKALAPAHALAQMDPAPARVPAPARLPFGSPPAMTPARDFSTISPSARSLLLVKAQTSLPFARQAAELLWGTGAVKEAERETVATPSAVDRRLHLEQRARSIDAAIESLGSTRVLELASGLSFRGLDRAARRADVIYVDTDLPEMVATKADLVRRLHPEPLRGTLLVNPLNAVEPEAFRASVDRLPLAAIAVVQEGLLMYLDEAEKAALATNVRAALLGRGGAWVIADVYVRSAFKPQRDERSAKFLEEHRVEEKKFADYDAAAAFFESQGFSIARRISPEADPWPVRQTWVLEAVR